MQTADSWRNYGPSHDAQAIGSRYHGQGNFSAPSAYALGGRFRALLNAYLLWFFLGWVGGHRVFLKAPLSATIQAVLLCLGVALWFQGPANHPVALLLMALHAGWRIADLWLIPELVRQSAEIDELD